MAVNLSNLLSSLTTGQLATIDYLAGVDQNGTALTTVSTSWRQYVANTTTPPSNSNVFTFGAGAVVTIGFYGTGAEAFSDADKAYAWQALSLWSSLMGISFKYVSDTTKAEVNFVHASDTYGTAKTPAHTSWRRPGLRQRHRESSGRRRASSTTIMAAALATSLVTR